MHRYKIELAYKGSAFHGWQVQINATSIQGEINKAFSLLFSYDISCIGCGRTDTGVNARKYIAHVDLKRKIENIEHCIYKLNCILHKTIAIKSISLTDDSFNARFSAKERRYKYFIHTSKNPFLYESSYLCPYDLDLDEMNRCAKLLLGEHDFTSFSKLHTDVKTNICTVTEIYWKRDDNGLVFSISADRFLRDMVRAIVGTLVDVGRNKTSPEGFVKIVEAKDRAKAGISVPAQGLYLWDIKY